MSVITTVRSFPQRQFDGECPNTPHHKAITVCVSVCESESEFLCMSERESVCVRAAISWFWI